MRSGPAESSVLVCASLSLLAVLAFGSGCKPSTEGNNGDCGDQVCKLGQLCVENECRTVCRSKANCLPSEDCADGLCEPADAGECRGAADCVEPGLCETAAGATCVGGACNYPVVEGGSCTDDNNCTVKDRCTAAGECVSDPVVCRQSTPPNVCLGAIGICDPLSRGGACEGAGCCVFGPAWPDGSPAPQPSCPFSGEDPNRDGVEGVDESWSGVCDHDGNCAGCTGDAQCDDSFACTEDSCDLGACHNDPIPGGDCTLGSGAPGRCVVQGPAATCLPAAGEACVAGTDCASGICVCADAACTTRVCHEAGCATCQWYDGSIGSCQPTAAGSHGEGCTVHGFACGASGDCRLADGEWCAENSDCISGQCECSSSDCPAARMICSAVDCDCRYNADGDDTCDGLLGSGVEDPDVSCGGTGCDGSGKCAGEAGLPCTFDNECASSHCVDGFCCNSPCGGNCDRCDQPGSIGTCVLDDTWCTGTCDVCGPAGDCEAAVSACTGNCSVCTGVGTAFSCAPNSTACPGSCEECAGSGVSYNCALLPEGRAGNPSCTPARCNGKSPICPSSCTNDGDCVGGAFCCGNTCAPDMVDVCTDGVNAIGPIAEGGAASSGLRFMGGPGTEHWYHVTFPEDPKPDTNSRGVGMPKITFSRNDITNDQDPAFRFDVYSTCDTAADTALASWEFWDWCLDADGEAQTTPGETHGCKTRDVAWPDNVWIRVARTNPGQTCQGYELYLERPQPPPPPSP